MKKDVYVYPAVLTQYEDNIGITFPDLPGCVSNSGNMDGVVKNAREALSLHLFGMEEDNIEIPSPSPANKIELNKNEMLLLVDVYMPLYRQAIQGTTVKTTVTMPQWLKVLAEENNVNFSQLLQVSLKNYLGIK
ncbi:MAG: type II toxin-antitoxin system HicB family antitoxin [Clostridiaceae bacterium]|nr:type II toxin-antitoxin system HicB family antitoxin [Clostridiaceae bacterium]